MENFGCFPVTLLTSLLEVIEKVLEPAVVTRAADQENCLPHQHVPEQMLLEKEKTILVVTNVSFPSYRLQTDNGKGGAR